MRSTSPPRVVHGGVLRVHSSPWASDVKSSHEATNVPSCSTMLSHSYWKNRDFCFCVCERENVREREREREREAKKKIKQSAIGMFGFRLLYCWILCFVSKAKKVQRWKRKENKLKIKKIIFFIFVLSIFQLIFQFFSKMEFFYWLLL